MLSPKRDVRRLPIRGGCGGYSTAEELSGCAAGGAVVHTDVGDGFRLQRTEFCLSWLSAYRCVGTNAIKKLEGRIYAENQTQLFIETPYRNNKLAEELIRTCRPSTKLCIASDITCEDEYIHTRPVKDWAGKVPDLSKKPTIFLIYK